MLYPCGRIHSYFVMNMLSLLLHTVACTHLTPTATFDVQDVTVAVGPGTITVVCSFAGGSDARGCHIVISEQNSGEEVGRNATRPLLSGSVLALTVTHTENSLQPGVYDVSVFDLENDGCIDLQSTVHTQRVDITEPPTPTPTPVPSLAPGKLLECDNLFFRLLDLKYQIDDACESGHKIPHEYDVILI